MACRGRRLRGPPIRLEVDLAVPGALDDRGPGLAVLGDPEKAAAIGLLDPLAPIEDPLHPPPVLRLEVGVGAGAAVRSRSTAAPRARSRAVTSRFYGAAGSRRSGYNPVQLRGVEETPACVAEQQLRPYIINSGCCAGVLAVPTLAALSPFGGGPWLILSGRIWPDSRARTVPPNLSESCQVTVSQVIPANVSHASSEEVANTRSI